MADPERNAADLTAIPLALAGWLRYLLGKDDTGADMAVSPDPLLGELQTALAGIENGQPSTAYGRLDALLDDARLFGVSLKEAGLDGKVTDFFMSMLAGPGAVRATLHNNI